MSLEAKTKLLLDIQHCRQLLNCKEPAPRSTDDLPAIRAEYERLRFEHERRQYRELVKQWQDAVEELIAAIPKGKVINIE